MLAKAYLSSPAALADSVRERRRRLDAHDAATKAERVALDRVDDLIASGELVDAKSIIGLLLARQFLATR